MLLKSISIIIFLCFQCSYASHGNITKYLKYLPFSHFGQIGDYKKGEMQIVDTYDAIIKVQDQYYREFIEKGFSSIDAEKYSRVGVVFEDKYWIWLRDPIILPNGKTTAYNRIIATNGLNGASGVSVMVISKENKVLVNITFRHATRGWEIELPRGGRKIFETSEMAALRELEEETGVKAKSAVKIASIASDSGILTNVLDVFVVKNFSNSNETKREEFEAIYECLFLSKKELKEAFVNGFVELSIKGSKVKVFCRDAFLASALLIAETKGIL